MNFIKLIATILLFSSCHRAMIPLTEAEKEFQEKLRNACNCNVRLEHDYHALVLTKSKGIFLIELSGELCNEDQTVLQTKAEEVFQEFYPILSQKNHYKKVLIDFSKTEHVTHGMEQSTCSKNFEFVF